MTARADRRRIPLRWSLAEEDEEGALFPDETATTRHVGTGEFRGMEFLHVNARSIVNPVPAASRMSFRYTINPYRGCSHACNYCFARPTHDYLGLDIGEDFERRIVVKVNAVERLRAELRSPKWAGEHIAMGTNTDPYQSAEGKYHLTQGVVSTLAEHRNPFSILTKSTLILRDLKLLTAAARRTPVHLNFSIGTLDRQVWKLTEPGTPPPERRLSAVRKLNEAGIPCGVLIAPVLPGLSDGDEQVREVVEACVDAGAISVAAIGLHLRPGVREHFMGWLAGQRPDLIPLYERRFRRGAYQPKAEQARLSGLVADVLQQKGTGTRQVRRYIEDLEEGGGGGPGIVRAGIVRAGIVRGGRRPGGGAGRPARPGARTAAGSHRAGGRGTASASLGSFR
ncbi:MAG TPA: radical SAM protein [Acidimicrobiales bacterium]|nr:radical SAM protein [Acidimicrobiales bacterium]